jgi:hypothetical protein
MPPHLPSPIEKPVIERAVKALKDADLIPRGTPGYCFATKAACLQCQSCGRYKCKVSCPYHEHHMQLQGLYEYVLVQRNQPAATSAAARLRMLQQLAACRELYQLDEVLMMREDGLRGGAYNV